jgi:hypothetical protein
MTKEHLQTLRNRKCLNFFDKVNKLFVKIQFNHKEKDFVCWERYVSLDRRSWVNHNLYLSLHDVNNIIESFKKK